MFKVERVIHRLRADEGYRQFPYRCTAGVWTLGYGSTRFHGEPVGEFSGPITMEEALVCLRSDAFNAVGDCQAIYGPAFDYLPAVHQEVLILLAYQLGRNKLQGFVKMNEAVEYRDFTGWCRELRDSKLYRQTTKRIDRYIEAVATGQWPTE